MNVDIKAGVAKGTVTAPPSKSMAHRLLLCAAMCEGKSIIRGISSCTDVLATLDCLRALGIAYEQNGTDVTIHGKSPCHTVPTEPLRCRESGSTLRFMIPIAMMNGKSTVFYGEDSLMSRPLHVYETLFSEHGKTFLSDGRSVIVKGPLDGGDYTLVGNVSSQFISGLLFALPFAKKDSTVHILPPIESRSYIDLTMDALRSFGINTAWKDDFTLTIAGGQTPHPADIRVEGDYSGAAFTDAFNILGGNVRVEGLREDSIQGDRVYKKYFSMLERGVPTIHIGDCPDLGPILFALAAAKNGGVFSGTRRLRLKESDRARAIAEELTKFGTSVSVYEDSVVVYPADFHAPVQPLNGHNDHRIVMALSVLLSLTGGCIHGAEAVSKSYPAFFDHLRTLGLEMVCHDT